jgi:hypothetical protein
LPSPRLTSVPMVRCVQSSSTGVTGPSAPALIGRGWPLSPRASCPDSCGPEALLDACQVGQLDCAGRQAARLGIGQVYTNVPGIGPLGDLASHFQLKHRANAEARLVRYNLLHPGHPRRAALPSCRPRCSPTHRSPPRARPSKICQHSSIAFAQPTCRGSVRRKHSSAGDSFMNASKCHRPGILWRRELPGCLPAGTRASWRCPVRRHGELARGGFPHRRFGSLWNQPSTQPTSSSG